MKAREEGVDQMDTELIQVEGRVFGHELRQEAVRWSKVVKGRRDWKQMATEAEGRDISKV